jgi:hypothetical protein
MSLMAMPGPTLESDGLRLDGLDDLTAFNARGAHILTVHRLADLHPNALEVGRERPFGPIVGVTDSVSHAGGFAADETLCHYAISMISG